VGRRILYSIPASDAFQVSEAGWQEVQRLQHWYNSEFSWSSGRLVFRRYVLFVNAEEFSDLDCSPAEIFEKRKAFLKDQGLDELAMVTQLEKDGLVTVKWGGYQDACYASGFTRVADNEWNAYLVCDFLLKVSLALPGAMVVARDEGRFITTGSVRFRNGAVEVPVVKGREARLEKERVRTRRVFAFVDRDRYSKHKPFRNTIPQFLERDADERQKLVGDWNWLGFGNADVSSDEPQSGLDLNKKVKRFDVVELPA